MRLAVLVPPRCELWRHDMKQNVESDELVNEVGIARLKHEPVCDAVGSSIQVLAALAVVEAFGAEMVRKIEVLKLEPGGQLEPRAQGCPAV
jgi:hypothetical protein